MSPRHLTPLTDGHDRSVVDASLYFVGADHAVNGGMAMGMQGWSCGFRIAQHLGLVPAEARFSLESLPERQRDIIAARPRRRVRHLQVGAVIASAATALVIALLRHRAW